MKNQTATINALRKAFKANREAQNTLERIQNEKRWKRIAEGKVVSYKLEA